MTPGWVNSDTSSRADWALIGKRGAMGLAAIPVNAGMVTGGSRLELVARSEKRPAGGAQRQREDERVERAEHQIALGMTGKAVPEAVDHVEERVEVADRLEGLAQPADRIERAGQHGKGHDDEVLH